MDEQSINIKRPTAVDVPNAVKMAMENNNPSKTEQPKYPSEPIGLPSEGYFYPEDSVLSRGTVDIKYMTAKEEDILTSQNLIKKGVVLERLLESLIVTPGIKLDDILVGDKNALFIAARRLAYGDSYGPVEVVCRNCAESNKKTIDLSIIKNGDFDFSRFTKGQNVFEYVLPTSKRTIVYKLLTHKDENTIETEIESLKKISKNGSSPEITVRLKKMIVSIDGNSDRQFINKFVENEFIAKDSLSFRTYVKNNTPNVDMGFEFICDYCGHAERMDVPLTVSFFWPNV